MLTNARRRKMITGTEQEEEKEASLTHTSVPVCLWFYNCHRWSHRSNCNGAKCPPCWKYLLWNTIGTVNLAVIFRPAHVLYIRYYLSPLSSNSHSHLFFTSCFAFNVPSLLSSLIAHLNLGSRISLVFSFKVCLRNVGVHVYIVYQTTRRHMAEYYNFHIHRR